MSVTVLITQAFFVREKLKGQKLKLFSKLKAKNSRPFPKTQSTGGFSA